MPLAPRQPDNCQPPSESQRVVFARAGPPGELLDPQVAERDVSEEVPLRIAEETLRIWVVRKLREMKLVTKTGVVWIREKITRRPLYRTAAAYRLECHQPVPRLACSDRSGFQPQNKLANATHEASIGPVPCGHVCTYVCVCVSPRLAFLQTLPTDSRSIVP